MHPSYGFQHSLFEPDFQMTEQIGWGLNDHDFLQQMVPRLERCRGRSRAWLITLSLHHPFESISRRAQGAEARRARRHVVRQLPAHDALLRSGARGFQARAGARRPARRQPDGGLRRSRCRVSRTTPRWRARSASAPTDAAWALNDRVPLFVALCQGCVPLAGAMPTSPCDRASGGADRFRADAARAARHRCRRRCRTSGAICSARRDDPPVPASVRRLARRAHLFLTPAAATSAACYRSSSRSVDADRSCVCRGTRMRAPRARGLSRLIVLDDLQQRAAARASRR